MEDYDCDKIGIPEDLKPKPAQINQPLLGSAVLNYYIKFRYSDNKGFPSDGTISIQKRASDANLDMWYGTMLSQESYELSGETNLTHVTLEKTPILKQTMFGSISFNGSDVFTFTTSSLNQLQITKVSTTGLDITYGWVNLNEGTIEIIWSVPPGPFQLKVDYEYNRE